MRLQKTTATWLGVFTGTLCIVGCGGNGTSIASEKAAPAATPAIASVHFGGAEQITNAGGVLTATVYISPARDVTHFEQSGLGYQYAYGANDSGVVVGKALNSGATCWVNGVP